MAQVVINIQMDQVVGMTTMPEKMSRQVATVWERPIARNLDGEKLLELTTWSTIRSRALAMVRRHIRKHLPQIKGLIAYGQHRAGHTGTIYEADNWFVS